MNDYMEKGKELIKKAGMFRILVVIVTGILLLLLSCDSFGGKEKEEAGESASTKDVQTEQKQSSSYKEQMEAQVKQILEKVDGVGAVSVMLTLKASGEKVMLKDNTVSVDKSEEETVLIEDENKNTSPYVVQEAEPEIEGIVVVCSGGDRPVIQREIIAGISALFPVESHKIKVMKSKEAE